MSHYFRLSKFPVITDEGTYRVDVGLRRVHPIGYDELYALVYVKHKLFRPIVHEYTSTSTLAIDTWEGRYVELAQMVVREYESVLRQEREARQQSDEGIREFEQWDGDMREYRSYECYQSSSH